jgi:hypothetical protein
MLAFCLRCIVDRSTMRAFWKSCILGTFRSYILHASSYMKWQYIDRWSCVFRTIYIYTFSQDFLAYASTIFVQFHCETWWVLLNCFHSTHTHTHKTVCCNETWWVYVTPSVACSSCALTLRNISGSGFNHMVNMHITLVVSIMWLICMNTWKRRGGVWGMLHSISMDAMFKI